MTAPFSPRRSLAILALLLAGCSSSADRVSAPPTTFSVGGSVSGLVGSGLLLHDRKTNFETHPTADGPFTIESDLPDGSPYEVVVATQPTNPVQRCTVFGGSGAITGADVTNIGVDCDAPVANRSLDPDFGSGGIATAPVPGGATALALQPDGKIVVGGESKVLRFNADGTLDQTFGTAGAADFTFPDVQAPTSQSPRGIVLQSDGKIVVAGFAQSGLTVNSQAVVARYDVNGTLDGSFGTGGRVTVDFGGVSARVHAVALQTDGKIVLGGDVTFASATVVLDTTDFGIARLTTDGRLDPTFGANGRAHAHFADAQIAEAFGVAIQRDGSGRIVLVGGVAPDGGTDPDVGLASFNGDGSVDTTFGRANGVRGKIRTNMGIPGAFLQAHGVAITGNGSIVIAGEAISGGSFQFLTSTFGAEGGGGGPVLTSLTAKGDIGQAIALDADGRAVVVGRAALSDTSDFGIVRFSSVGGLDSDFGDAGKLVVDLFGGFDGAQAVAIQPDGKIVVAGFAQNGTASVLGLVRVVP